ncbi:MAG: deoxycytidylate deaminase [Alphaproteobacteria bacterium]|jgi:dCMP deaminase
MYVKFKDISKTRASWDEIYLFKAACMATMSHCVSRKVAAIIVKNGREIATGINGTPENCTNCDEIFPPKNSCDYNRDEHHQFQLMHEIHAEMNAIAFAAKNGISTNKATLYCTTEPCNDCLKAIIAAGIKRVVYSEKYSYAHRDKLMLANLNKLGIKVEHIPIKIKFAVNTINEKTK